jgi:ligand-binding SRPBCC domain-containing protein
MRVYQIIKEQLINASLESVWNFFSHPANLQRITPEHMRFGVTSGELPDQIYAGQIITYKVAPLFGIPLFWMTEITHVEPLRMFVDEQRRGPYRLWHHEHHFSQTADGKVLMRDIIYYQLPLGFLGVLAHKLFVRKQLADIFEYREAQVSAFFP